MINQGIAATVDDKVDAYRANPDALAQRAKGSQDLLDLLALAGKQRERSCQTADSTEHAASPRHYSGTARS